MTGLTGLLKDRAKEVTKTKRAAQVLAAEKRSRLERGAPFDAELEKAFEERTEAYQVALKAFVAQKRLNQVGV